MLHVLLLPFQFAWSILGIAMDVVMGALSLVFGILGSLFSFLWHFLAVGLIVGILAAALHKRNGRKADDWKREKFTSFYHRDGSA